MDSQDTTTTTPRPTLSSMPTEMKQLIAANVGEQGTYARLHLLTLLARTCKDWEPVAREELYKRMILSKEGTEMLLTRIADCPVSEAVDNAATEEPVAGYPLSDESKLARLLDSLNCIEHITYDAVTTWQLVDDATKALKRLAKRGHLTFERLNGLSWTLTAFMDGYRTSTWDRQLVADPIPWLRSKDSVSRCFWFPDLRRQSTATQVGGHLPLDWTLFVAQLAQDRDYILDIHAQMESLDAGESIFDFSDKTAPLDRLIAVPKEKPHRPPPSISVWGRSDL